MYLQSLVGDGSRLLQGAARITRAEAARFAPVFNRIVGGWTALGGASAGLRLAITGDGVAATTFFLAAFEEHEFGLRRLFARLALLDGVSGAQVAIADSPSEFDQLREGWPAVTIARDGPLRTPSGAQLLCRGVWPDLPVVIAGRMAALGADFAVHVNVTRASAGSETLKTWGRALVELDGPSTPPSLRQHQQTEFAAARQAVFNIETFWGTEPRFADVLSNSLDEAVHLREPALRQTGLHGVFEGAPEPVVEALHAAILAGEDFPASNAAAGFASQSEAALALGFPVTPGVSHVFAPSETGSNRDRSGVDRGDLPPVVEHEKFCFVSYAHSDAAAVYEILHRFDKGNIAYWYDRGIPAGEQWDEELEARLAACTTVVAFLSPRSVQSRYCRREIKYADILGKQILPIMLEATRLEGGLSFLLSHIQHADANDPRLVHWLANSIGGPR